MSVKNIALFASAALVAGAAAAGLPDIAVCTADKDCVPAANGVALQCVNNKCVPAEGPFPDNNMVVPPQHKPHPRPPKPEHNGVCTDLPLGFCRPGAMIPNVPYTVPAMYGCEETCDGDMTIWCAVDKKTKKNNYWYCCDDKCKHMPEERHCKVDGKKYIVGESYDIKLKGKKVTMWCTSETEYKTCAGKQCGSCPELTPPGRFEICPVEKVEDLLNKPVSPGFGPSGDVMPSVDALNQQCRDCIATGGSFNAASRECTAPGIQCRSADCITKADSCPVESFGVMPIAAAH